MNKIDTVEKANELNIIDEIQNQSLYIGLGSLILYFLLIAVNGIEFFPLWLRTSNIFAYIVVICYFTLIQVRKKKKVKLASFKWQKKLSIVEKTILTVTAYLIATIFIDLNALFLLITTPTLNPENLTSISYKTMSWSTFLLIIFFSSIFEEIIFRNFMVKSLAKYDVMFAIISISIIFAMAHAVGVVYAFISSVLFGMLYICTRSIIFPCLMHLAINFPSDLTYAKFMGKYGELSTNTIINQALISIGISLLLLALIFVIFKNNAKLRVIFINFTPVAIYKSIKINKKLYKAFFSSVPIAFYLILTFSAVLMYYAFLITK
ncbi:type II CAAX prenyl endopeptidase Rce1 family protein [Mycoplasma sp. P36-A1]|uniref:CPBP family glutamic-type intramembrane protease n=1 Tax=Mycoplasma sp. P36-A1 TaxID=3252900 RepID=UPI003C2F4291